MRTCVQCKAELTRNNGESVKQFCARKYCDRDCVMAARRERAESFKYSEAQAVQRKAEVMGGNAKVSNALLNAEKVRKIRELHRPLGFDSKEISEHMNVKEECIKKVLRGVTWRHVV